MSNPNSVAPAVDARPSRFMFELGVMRALVILVSAIALEARKPLVGRLPARPLPPTMRIKRLVALVTLR